ncbi:MAG: hypothetical protein PVF43_13800 [Candidatus Eiseniibacteriota bacterium]|jgi:hypothetical protein
MHSRVTVSLLAATLSVTGAMSRGRSVTPALAGDCSPCVDYATEPSSEPLGTLDVTDEPFDIELRGDVVYLANSSYQDPEVHELATVDVSDPAMPRLLDRESSPHGHRSVDVDGDHAYVVDPDLVRFDVSDPSAIEIDGLLDFGVHPGERAVQIEVDGDLAFVVTEIDGQSDERLWIVDVGGDPAFLGSVTLPYRLNDLAVLGRYVYAVGYGGVHVIDVADPLHPVHVETVTTENQVVDIELAGAFALVSVFERQLQILDLSVPGAPVVVGPGPALARIFVAGELLYAPYASAVAVYDLSDPTAVTRIGALDNVYAFSLAVDGCRLATVNWFIGDELRMFPVHCGATTTVGGEPAPRADRWVTRAVPNPFHAETAIELDLPLLAGATGAEVAIHDVSGRLVRRLQAPRADARPAGAPVRVIWDGRDTRGRRSVPGNYFYRLDGGGPAGTVTGRVTLIR